MKTHVEFRSDRLWWTKEGLIHLTLEPENR
jgi:hypothetical protein